MLICRASVLATGGNPALKVMKTPGRLMNGAVLREKIIPGGLVYITVLKRKQQCLKEYLARISLR